MQSLQRRVILGGLVWALLVTFVGGFALTSIFDGIADRRFNATLSERHTQLVAALSDAQNIEDIEIFLNDPAYFRIYSGRYWQVVGENGRQITSRSLFDESLQVNATDAFWEDQGPTGPLRGYSEVIELESNGSVWNVAVAESLNALEAERSEMRRNVLLAFGIVGALGIAAAAVLTTFLIAPLRALREDVLHRWDNDKALKPESYPSEVAPLVSDINTLMSRNRDIVDRGRRQAADLAHALKTPSAALRNTLQSSEHAKQLTDAVDALDRIDAQITRSLARMRASHASESVNLQLDIAKACARMERLFRTLPTTSDKEFQVSCIPLNVAIDQQDLEEMLGNLLENAFKWSDGKVHLTVVRNRHDAIISVEDDGPGVDPARRNAVLAEGGRLDTSVPGTGLGLSIANDLANAYGGRIELTESQSLGGLSVQIFLPLHPTTMNNPEN